MKSLFLGLMILGALLQSVSAMAGEKHGFSPQKLNKRFVNEANQAGPLAGNEKLAPASEIVLLWGEPSPGAQPGANEPDRATLQIFSFIKDQPNLPADQRLVEKGTLTAEGRSIGVVNNENMKVATGDLNGDGFDDVATVWEAPGQNVFLQLNLITQDGQLTFTNTSIKGINSSGLTQQISPTSGQIGLTIGDVLGTGREQILFAHQDVVKNNQIHVLVFSFDETQWGFLKFETQIWIEGASDVGEEALFDITTADLNQDGDKEVVLAGLYGGPYLHVLDIDENGKLKSMARATPNWPISGEATSLSLASGDFDSDGQADIGIGVTSFQSGRIYASVHFAQTTLSLDSIAAGPEYSVEMELSPAGSPLGGSCAAGDLNADGADELVMAAGATVMVFEAEARNGGIAPVKRAETQALTREDDQASAFSRQYIDVADMDRDRKQEIVFAGNQYNLDDGTAFQAMEIWVFENQADTGFQLAVKARKQNYRAETVSDHIDFRRHYAVALGDFDGDGLRAGKPRRFSKTDIVRPIVILNAPPVHFDILDNQIYDLNSCFDKNGCPQFAATYDRSTTSQEIVTTEVTTSWGVSTTVDGEVNTATVTASASLTAKYGRDFSKIQGSSQQTTVTINVDAVEDDQIYAIVSDYDIWEYPLLEEGKTVAYLLVTVPRITEARWFPGNSWSAFSYIPDHEVGNILSYREYASFDQNGYIREKIKGNLAVDDINSFSLNATSDYEWTLQFTDFATNSASQSQTYGMEVGARVEVGRDFGVFGAKVGVEVNGDYSGSNLTSHTSTVTNALSLRVRLGAIDRSIGEVEYIVTPFAYWAQNGAIVIDYAARPELSQPGFPRTWWQEKYGDHPDPALTLPFRYFPEKGRPLQNEARRFQTKEIVFDPKQPQPGDLVKITARLHNYSLAPTPGPVKVRFFVGDPDNGGLLIASPSDQTVVETQDFIAARDTAFVQMEWIVPPSFHRDYVFDGQYVRIYAQIDPDNEITEVHENNNKGWNALQIPDITVTSVTQEAPGALPAAFRLHRAYPNPFNPSTAIQFDLPETADVRLEVFDILGRRVRLLLKARKPAGRHTVRWDGADDAGHRVVSGVYIFQLQADGRKCVAKVTLVR